MAVSRFKQAYQQQWRYAGNGREYLVLGALLTRLRPPYTVRLTGLGAGDPRLLPGSDGHQPDLTVYRQDQSIAGIEVTGTWLTWEKARREGLWVLPDKIRAAKQWGDTYILVHILDPEFPRGEWLHWIPGFALDYAHTWPITKRCAASGLEEHFIAVDPQAWHNSLTGLIRHIKLLAGDL